MDWGTAYLGCFVLGVTFVALAAAFGHFGDGDLSGGHGDMHDGVQGVHLPVFSPTVLSVFLGMFGAGGLILLEGLGLTSPALHVTGAAAISATSGLGVAYAMLKLLKTVESNSIPSHDELVGREVEVLLAIRDGRTGEIAYEAGGTRQTMNARADAGQTFAQGERVQVIQVTGGTALIGPVGSRSALQMVAVDPGSIGVPVETKTRVK